MGLKWELAWSSTSWGASWWSKGEGGCRLLALPRSHLSFSPDPFPFLSITSVSAFGLHRIKRPLPSVYLVYDRVKRIMCMNWSYVPAGAPTILFTELTFWKKVA